MDGLFEHAEQHDVYAERGAPCPTFAVHLFRRRDAARRPSCAEAAAHEEEGKHSLPTQ